MVRISKSTQELISFPAGTGSIEGSLIIPDGARGVVLFAHGTGSSSKSPRNRFVSQELNDAGLATLLIDFLTQEEAAGLEADDLRFDIDLLAQRLESAIEWLSQYRPTMNLNVGLFGASTGAAVALVAAARMPERIKAVVSRGGRPEIAGASLSEVKAPVLMIVGARDLAVFRLNKAAADQLLAEKEIKVITGASNLFEEPNALEEVARFAASWFTRYLK